MEYGRIVYDDFTDAYITAALWSSTDGEDNPAPLDEDYTYRDISHDSLARMLLDCHEFQALHADDIGDMSTQAGIDFWLTRVGHGAGFWDGGWPEPSAGRLAAAAHEAGHVDLYIGDDDLLYLV